MYFFIQFNYSTSLVAPDSSNLLAVDALHDPMDLCIAQPLFRQYWRMDKFNFGVMGRRLKTWHKIQSFQKEVKQPRQASAEGKSFVPILDNGFFLFSITDTEAGSKMMISQAFPQGNVNGIETNLRLSPRADGYVHQQQQDRLSAWAVTTSKSACFAEGGDSGSLILRFDGVIIGLLFAADWDGTGYFTPFQDIISDIEAVTGAEVTQPSQIS